MAVRVTGRWRRTEASSTSATPRFLGSLGAQTLNKPIGGMAGTSGGAGYRMVASDGGIFAFGDAEFDGSMGGGPLNAPIVGIASSQ